MMRRGSAPQRITNNEAAPASKPGQHWIALGAGLAAWLLTRKHPSVIVRGAGMMAGTALVGRAASGRDGLAKLIKVLPIGRGLPFRR